MKLHIQAATIVRKVRTLPGFELKRVTLNGKPDGSAYSVADTIEPGHFWEGWTIHAAVDCGTLHTA